MTQSTRGATISHVSGREILDSRGNPTVEAEVVLSNGVRARAAVPSGASTGTHEAVELRDGDPSRYRGVGVAKAVGNVDRIIGPELIGRSPLDQASIDGRLNELDGTPNKANLGANAILAVSLAVAKAGAMAANDANPTEERLWQHLCQGGEVSLPVPMFNILNGGRHASDSTDVQEFMVAPAGLPTFSDALKAGVEIYHALRALLRDGGHNLNVGDEGGFAPSLPSNRDALELVVKAIDSAGYRPGVDVFLTLDVAASELYDRGQGKYVLAREGTTMTAGELIDLYDEWRRQYPIISIEDGLDEDDWEGWQALVSRVGETVQLVGDDVFVTNLERIKGGIDTKAGTAVLLKPNQIGTLTETHEAFKMARNAGWGTVMSHRSGETEDTTIADLAVGWDVRQIKTGAPARSERVAKYNRLLRIEAQLGDRAKFAGFGAYSHLHRSF
jgi:enolase